MKLEMTVKQRINLQSILPEQGNFLTIKMVRVLKEALSFSQEEHDLLKFEYHKDGGVVWDGEAAERCIKEITIPETLVKTITETLEKADAQGRITEAHLDFYELFIKPDETS